MEQVKRKRIVPAKSVRLGWRSMSEQKPQQLSCMAGKGIKVEEGMFSNCQSNSANYLIP